MICGSAKPRVHPLGEHRERHIIITWSARKQLHTPTLFSQYKHEHWTLISPMINSYIDEEYLLLSRINHPSMSSIFSWLDLQKGIHGSLYSVLLSPWSIFASKVFSTSSPLSHKPLITKLLTKSLKNCKTLRKISNVNLKEINSLWNPYN